MDDAKVIRVRMNCHRMSNFPTMLSVFFYSHFVLGIQHPLEKRLHCLVV